MVCHSSIRTLPIHCHSTSLRKKSGCLNIKRFVMRLSHSYLKKMATEPIKVEGRYVHGKLKTWKECIKTNFHSQDVSYDMYCNAPALLNINSFYKQDKNYHPLVNVEEFKCTDAENQQCNMLSDDDGDDDGFFEV